MYLHLRLNSNEISYRRKFFAQMQKGFVIYYLTVLGQVLLLQFLANHITIKKTQKLNYKTSNFV